MIEQLIGASTEGPDDDGAGLQGPGVDEVFDIEFEEGDIADVFANVGDAGASGAEMLASLLQAAASSEDREMPMNQALDTLQNLQAELERIELAKQERQDLRQRQRQHAEASED